MYFISFQDYFKENMLVLSKREEGHCIQWTIQISALKVFIDINPKIGVSDMKKTPKSHTTIKMSSKIISWVI